MAKDINPRYAAYATAHGKTPDEMLAHDDERFPGGKMCGFLMWMSERWQEWRKANGRKRDSYLSPEDYKSFEAYIETFGTSVAGGEVQAPTDRSMGPHEPQAKAAPATDESRVA